MADTDILIKDLPLTETVNDSDDLVTEDSSPTTHRIKASVVKNYINAEQNDELDGIKVDLDNVNSNIGSLSSKVDDATVAVSSMQTSLNSMDGRVQTNTDNISSLSLHVVTTSNENLNNYTTTGTYYFSGSYTPTNIPAGTNGWLVVMRGSSASIVKQVWYRQGTSDSNDFQTFVRTYNGGIWSEWRQYEIAYHSGDSLSFTYYETAGFVTNSSTDIRFSIPLDKSVQSGTSVSSVSLSLILRQNGNYTHGSSSSTAVEPSSISATLYGSVVNIVATMSSITNATNNDACGVRANNVVITFS